MNKTILILFLSVLLVGCTDPRYAATGRMKLPEVPLAQHEPEGNPAYLQVELVQVIEDGLAYNEKRGIYRIIHVPSGTEFFGISGIGVYEVGDHKQGRTRKQDER
jgi:hypothetical protein